MALSTYVLIILAPKTMLLVTEWLQPLLTQAT